MENDKPLLDNAIFTFTQDSNCLSADGAVEELKIECNSDIGIDGMGRCFYILKTDGWSIDSLEDLQMLLDRIHKSLFPEKTP